MSDEKKIPEEDDWLEDFEDAAEEIFSELDQANIDALLSDSLNETTDRAPAPEPSSAEEAGKQEEEQKAEAPAEPAPVNEGPDESAGEAKIDQADIDALLGSEAADEISSGIDSLVADREAKPLKPQESEAAKEPSEEEIMTLGEEEPPAETAAPAGEETAEQPAEEEPGLEAAEEEAEAQAPVEEGEEEPEVPSQEEMDKLFSEATGSDDDLFGTADVDMLGGVGDEAFNFGTTDGFDVDVTEFDLDQDIPEIPDEKTAAALETGAVSPDEETEYTSTEGMGPPLYQRITENKPVLAAIAGGLVVVVAIALYLLSGNGSEEEGVVPGTREIAVQDQYLPPAMTAQQAAPPPAANEPPQASDGRYQLSEKGDAVKILLAGQDADGDPLLYSIVSTPLFGTLTGEPPEMLYSPEKDFPGKDKFLFAVSDDKDASSPATVFIEGPDLRRVLPGKPVLITPKRPLLAARDITLDAVSTEPLIIDWQKIWQEANELPFSSRVSVEITAKNLQGVLEKISPALHRYQPDRFFSGQESLTYRFALAGSKSKPRVLRFAVESGNPAPEIHLHPLAKAAYLVGETVMLDARQTRDDDRETVSFSWEQTDGTPVHLAKINDEGSVVTFMVPSFFNTVENPGTALRLRVTDRSGKTDSRDIKINAVSRIRSALWGRLGSMKAPACPRSDCAAGLLPLSL